MSVNSVKQQEASAGSLVQRVASKMERYGWTVIDAREAEGSVAVQHDKERSVTVYGLGHLEDPSVMITDSWYGRTKHERYASAHDATARALTLLADWADGRNPE